MPETGDGKRSIFWADSKACIRSFPRPARVDIGHALTLVEQGKPPPRFAHVPELGSGIMELKVDHARETYHVFYVAKFPEAIYILDALHKKSKHGKRLPEQDKSRIRRRYGELLHYRARYESR